ncbi:hypothetical protein NBRC10512_006638 [Rhodotorula toruloides]|uniref:RHTO0S07e04104g1_1 n=2 Tax=Rhodotorula toruloides TaxID=5286 RepID=A0A061AYN7_RHOTO|nr:putative protein lysine methyltransferase [Rhodotorula toruloides NP11]EMS25114.1 putative protein lysine methyltransferase [Rhodotorula toruloides NP11]CDR42784.1 RHTO0S07e04104g1_1 [Rhodotorula toruloides]
MSEDPVWDALLAWLRTFPNHVDPEKSVRLVHNEAGRGLVARGDSPPGSLLISIPNAALLNLRTLKPLYPPSFASLNAIQWLSLHLALQFRRHLHPDDRRPPLPNRTSSTSALPDNAKSASTAAPRPPRATPQDKYWPFIASLPRSFPTVPLTWSIHSRSLATLKADFSLSEDDVSLDQWQDDARKRKRLADLVELMDGATRRRARDVEKRFTEDRDVVRRLWADHGTEVEGELGFFDFLLGWLNVNTRCIYFDLDGRKENNLTLCPVIDMINHVPGRTTKPSPRIASMTFSAPSTSSGDPPLRDGDELAFSYGAHEDAMLLTEYGFVIGAENDYNVVEVDKYIKGLFEAQGREGELKVGVLKDEGYWGDMTLSAKPDPPSPSWRVLVALRLLHLRLPTLAVLSADSFAAWYNNINGVAETVSSANEAKVRASVQAICDAAAREAEEGVKRCEEVLRRWKKEGTDVDKEMEGNWRMVKTVWDEDVRIALGVKSEYEGK